MPVTSEIAALLRALRRTEKTVPDVPVSGRSGVGKVVPDLVNTPPRPTSLEDMSHHELLMLRKANPELFMQEALAPIEHKAFAREYVRDNPYAAPGIAMMAPAYALAKMLRAQKGRTEPSMDQIFGGWAGTTEGLKDYFSGWKPK